MLFSGMLCLYCSVFEYSCVISGVLCLCFSVFEFLMKSDILNIQHSQADLTCVSYVQKAALWHMYGNM